MARESVIDRTFGEDFDQYLAVLALDDYGLGALGQLRGAGDAFMAFRIRGKGSEYHVGWLRVNVSADLRTLKIIDAGYTEEPDVPIHAGRE